VSRCICSPRWSIRASDCLDTLAAVCRHASGSAATAANSCWAAGDDGHPIGANDVQFNLVLDWNGKRWCNRLTRPPAPTQTTG
jgi:hypothetical protein